MAGVIPSRTSVYAGVVAMLAVLTGCGGREAAPAHVDLPNVHAPDSALAARGEAALTALLDASREGHRNQTALDSLADCGAGEDAFFPAPLLATYVLLPSEMRGETLVGRAAVTTVAEQDHNNRRPGTYVARERLRVDTLEWDILDDPAGRLTICNGLQFGYLAPDSLTEWRPPGASYAHARAMADSIARSARNNPTR
jgi:hypothetical protein